MIHHDHDPHEHEHEREHVPAHGGGHVHEHPHDHSAAHQDHHHHDPEPGAAQLVECPVMLGNMVNPERAEAKGLYRDYQGKRFWFCCADCPPLWDADPARYAAAS
ncbi:hypothetical protein ACH3VR_22435 [Microbacterium sp. B2969]|uniref:YHS domain-containing protein n=1 Tax=Microbacterium alkaliflavum TaxID=3248839 RepID=A0ABW7QFA3_9MICO